MTAELVGHFEHGLPEWHQARMGGIGGSEIAAVLGLSKWESHFSLWHRKQTLIPDRPDNPDTEWGTRLEPVILQAFADRHPELVVDTRPGTWRNTDRPWQIANPDALAGPADPPPGSGRVRTTVVEAKNAASLMLDAIGNHRGATSGGRTIATRALRKGTNTTHSLKPARTL
jgi:putative phage-type endonuclease